MNNRHLNKGKHFPVRWLWAIVLSLAFSGGMYAQEQRIVFSDRTIVIEEAFKEIEKQTEVLISMNRSNFNLNKKVRLSHNNLPLNKALEELLAKTNKTYLIKGNHVLIIPVKQSAETAVVEPFSEEIEENIKQEEKIEQIEVPELLPASFNELALHKLPVDLDSLERALQARKIKYPVEIPSDPYLNKTLYYRKRDREISVTGIPEYANNLPTYALRTNLLYGFATLTPNIGAELRLGKASTAHTSFSYNGWKAEGSPKENDKLCHWLAQVEYRYWLCESFNGHFLGVNAFYGYYNISGKNIPLILESGADKYRYRGDVIGAGVSYGYQLILAPRWNLEFNIGIGIGRMKYDKSECDYCGDSLEKGVNRLFLAPNKLGVSLVYIFK